MSTVVGIREHPPGIPQVIKPGARLYHHEKNQSIYRHRRTVVLDRPSSDDRLTDAHILGR